LVAAIVAVICSGCLRSTGKSWEEVQVAVVQHLLSHQEVPVREYNELVRIWDSYSKTYLIDQLKVKGITPYQVNDLVYGRDVVVRMK